MRYLLFIVSIILLSACTENVKNPKQIDLKSIQEKLIEANKKALTLESTQIDDYVKKKNLNVVKSKTGLRYQIYNDVEGETIKENQVAVVKYKVTLLNGTECYSTKDGVEEFVVGKDYVESGLHEGITYMSVGDKAIIIMPSYLAHGLAGDLKKIPIRSTIVYDIELVAIK